jgi:hypothetical protein
LLSGYAATLQNHILVCIITVHHPPMANSSHISEHKQQRYVAGKVMAAEYVGTHEHINLMQKYSSLSYIKLIEDLNKNIQAGRRHDVNTVYLRYLHNYYTAL